MGYGFLKQEDDARLGRLDELMLNATRPLGVHVADGQLKGQDKTHTISLNMSTLHKRVESLFRRVVCKYLQTCPSQVPASAAFTLAKGRAMREHVLAAPRLAIHNALVSPEEYLRLGKRPRGLNHPEDASIAYQGYLKHGGESICLVDWLEDFCECSGVHVMDNKECQGRRQKETAVDGKEALARFEGAVADLQVAGVVRPTKRRACGVLKCNMYMECGKA
ncbi:unnamed protein product [Ostreobium quekettii]|uniref:Origin recognition complex subunit 3 winged helix C-terminal domain-containing protein n=1 Tax=Ostreobium quekettii TaxID=121088 RepID=A0A8S1IQC9_9CHLO|nr:unnamed protein product [Ostreobium quekettii]